MSRDSNGVFVKQQKNARPLRVRDRDVIANESFSSITMAEVVETGGQGTFKVRIYGTDYTTDQPVTVSKLTPHGSFKPSTAGGDDPGSFEDSQTASAMVTPTPQIGTKGIIIRANDRATSGYWLGSIFEPGVGQTFPDFGSTDQVTGEQADLDDLASPIGAPAAELNRTAYDGRVPSERARRAVHPFARVLQRQGLLVDTVRGQTTSNYLRDRDTRMIGFNTPGGIGESQDFVDSPARGGGTQPNARRLTRLGGHTFTMDDGDDAGRNNLVRIRSSKGAQILFHDTAELVYIGNQNGTAWIEMTADGKIDMYAKDSVSIHSEADFNFRADRDINFEAGRSMNLKGVGSVKINTDELRLIANVDGIIDIRGPLDISGANTRFTGNEVSLNADNLNIATKLNTEIRSGELDLVTQFGMRQSHGTGLEIKTNVLENQIWNKQTYNPQRTYYAGDSVVFGTQFFRALKPTVAPNTPSVPIPPAPGPYWELIPPVIPKTVHGDFRVDTNIAGPLDSKIQMYSKDSINITTLKNFDVTATTNMNLTAFTDVYIDGYNEVHLNKPGPGATPSEQILLSALATSIPIPFDTSAEYPKSATDLGVFENSTSDTSRPWNEAYYAGEETLFSIMRRIPQHEPWPGHEGQDKTLTNTTATDRENAGR